MPAPPFLSKRSVPLPLRRARYAPGWQFFEDPFFGFNDVSFFLIETRAPALTGPPFPCCRARARRALIEHMRERANVPFCLG